MIFVLFWIIKFVYQLGDHIRHRSVDTALVLPPWMYKMPFAASKILGEITFFYEDFGTDKEFVEDKILELGVTVLGC